MPKEYLKFISRRKDNIVTFNQNFVLLLAKIDLIPKKQGCKKDALAICSSSHIKIVFIL